MIWPILEARAEIELYFCSFFGSNENFKICFWNQLTFRQQINSAPDQLSIPLNKLPCFPKRTWGPRKECHWTPPKKTCIYASTNYRGYTLMEFNELFIPFWQLGFWLFLAMKLPKYDVIVYLLFYWARQDRQNRNLK